MKVTNTKIEKTLYDTNGKVLSVVKKEIVEVDTTPHYLGKEETKQLKEVVEVYKKNFTEAKKVKDNLEEIHGSVKGQRIFRSMADLIMVVDNPVNLKHVPESTTVTIRRTSNPTQNPTGSIWEQANEQYKDFQQSLTKKKKK